MAKAVILLTRRPDMSQAEFERYARDVHSPIVARFPGLRRFTRSFVRPFPGGTPAAYDAVFEVWFDDEPALWSAFASPEGQAQIADAHNFLDVSMFQLIVVEEDEVPLDGT